MNTKKIKICTKLTAIASVVVILSLQLTVLTAMSFADIDKSILPAIKHQDEGEYPEAITKYYSIIEKSPKNLQAYYNFAMVLEIVLADYKSAILLYDKAISIAENKIALFVPGHGGESKEELNSLLSRLNNGKEDSIRKMFNSIEGITFPRYIVLKSGKSVSSQPFVESSKLETSLDGSVNELQFINIEDNWYHVVLPSGEDAWVDGKDVRMIYRNSNQRRTIGKEAKSEEYKSFINSFPEHGLAKEAEKRMGKLSH